MQDWLKSPEYAKGCKRYKSKLSQRDRQLLVSFGITEADYQLMFDYQQGQCGICKTHQDDLSKRLAVDHCHETGRIRGLLCVKCNLAVGAFSDKKETIWRAYRWVLTEEEALNG